MVIGVVGPADGQTEDTRGEEEEGKEGLTVFKISEECWLAAAKEEIIKLCGSVSVLCFQYKDSNFFKDCKDCKRYLRDIL